MGLYEIRGERVRGVRRVLEEVGESGCHVLEGWVGVGEAACVFDELLELT